jgi:Cu2+-containing amine oxidase
MEMGRHLIIENTRKWDMDCMLNSTCSSGSRFDLGEYGAGYMTNSLTNGCDCKGTIHYMDADFVNRAGSVETIKNAICVWLSVSTHKRR